MLVTVVEHLACYSGLMLLELIRALFEVFAIICGALLIVQLSGFLSYALTFIAVVAVALLFDEGYLYTQDESAARTEVSSNAESAVDKKSHPETSTRAKTGAATENLNAVPILEQPNIITEPNDSTISGPNEESKREADDKPDQSNSIFDEEVVNADAAIAMAVAIAKASDITLKENRPVYKTKVEILQDFLAVMRAVEQTGREYLDELLRKDEDDHATA
ncbi:unnamed protein product [Zymoseptoria tritici ST99CH_1A5]|uniref:Uncharacterized protein n=3 Tax=Zymoseptoria tritici TaxID=1047171 RepID=A0A1X7S8D0_ZYMT9|nr:unnamed protein product [Zymoseptoria tritici ST99CH_3D7]SMR61069.1 unnamed protein product [Zymoseptoria tritici ST99CH_1E4]SMY29564.1 unnamed protein product [Zymoseptoria tritici ST99CH_1A5]